MKSSRLVARINEYRARKTKAFFRYSWYALPLLYLSFWFVDAQYAPDDKWIFLVLRCSFIPPVAGIYFLSKKTNRLENLRLLGVVYTLVASGLINAMIILSGDPHSIYYAGLNLVTLCSYLLFSLNKRYFAILTALAYCPYLAFEFYEISHGKPYSYLLVNLSFILGTIVVGLLHMVISNSLELKYVETNIKLEDEIADREQIIRLKTKESMALERLSSQFSPQIIDAIKSGKRPIDTQRHRAKICSIFVDVADSTERLISLEKDDFQEAIEIFMELSINTLLKYDLTIDKFYGDGVLAFSNDPVIRENFVERTCLAALDIRQQIEKKQPELIALWGKKFEITMGISTGLSSVGFYGNSSYIKQYSAIGPCLVLSQRLSSIANPNEILVDPDVFAVLQNGGFECSRKGNFKLKGFGQQRFEIFDVVSSPGQSPSEGLSVGCSACGENSIYIDEVEGIYIFKCRKCGHTESQNSSGFLKNAA